jgi:hypothetical protein
MSRQNRFGGIRQTPNTTSNQIDDQFIDDLLTENIDLSGVTFSVFDRNITPITIQEENEQPLPSIGSIREIIRPLFVPVRGRQIPNQREIDRQMAISRMRIEHYPEGYGRFAGSMCEICQEPWGSSKESTCVLPCQHTYHRECIAHWALNSDGCPKCRGYFSQNYI